MFKFPYLIQCKIQIKIIICANIKDKLLTSILPDPTEATAVDVTTPDVTDVFGRIMEALLLPVMLAEVFTTGTVIDFCSTLGEVCPDDIKITCK